MILSRIYGKMGIKVDLCAIPYIQLSTYLIISSAMIRWTFWRSTLTKIHIYIINRKYLYQVDEGRVLLNSDCFIYGSA